MAPPKLTPEMIAQVRAKVLSLYEDEKSLYEESDIARLKTEDLLVERYLTREQLDVLAAIETMNGAFRWGKRQGIGSIKESEFSQNFILWFNIKVKIKMVIVQFSFDTKQPRRLQKGIQKKLRN